MPGFRRPSHILYMIVSAIMYVLLYTIEWLIVKDTQFWEFTD